MILNAAHVTEFLNALATQRQVSASTQNQALAALLFLYREVLELDLPWLDGLVHAKSPARLPVILARGEVPGGPLAGRMMAGGEARPLYRSAYRLGPIQPIDVVCSGG